jgi:transmembrane sensor
MDAIVAAVDDPRTVTDVAVRWVARLSLDAVSQQDVAELKEWLNRDPSHRRAFDRARRMYAGLAAVEPAVRAPPRRSRFIVPALLAAAACMLLAVMPWLFQHDFSAPVGEVRQARLPDGSTLWLDSGAAVDFRNDARARVLEVSAGRVHVAIANDAGRPFQVRAMNAVIRDIGTAFTVDTHDARLQVSVSDGRVEVDFNDTVTPLASGESAQFVAGTTASVHGFDSHAEGAWRAGRIVLDHTSLEDTLRIVERYRRGFVILLDDDIGAMPMSGSLSVQDLDGGLDALAAGSGLQLRRLPFLLIVTPRG